MKTYIISFVILLIAGCSPSAKKEAQTTPNEPEVSFTSYGSEITNEDAIDALTIDELMANKDSAELKLTGKIEKTCKMKGCWMTVKTGDSTTMRVTFENYGFFVPKEGMEDVTTIFEGKVAKSTTSVEVLRHYAQDEGKSPEEIESITEPQDEYTFVATGVLIEDSE